MHAVTNKTGAGHVHKVCMLCITHVSYALHKKHVAYVQRHRGALLSGGGGCVGNATAVAGWEQAGSRA